LLGDEERKAVLRGGRLGAGVDAAALGGRASSPIARQANPEPVEV
jgi:hypothetical protein